MAGGAHPPRSRPSTTQWHKECSNMKPVHGIAGPHRLAAATAAAVVLLTVVAGTAATSAAAGAKATGAVTVPAPGAGPDAKVTVSRTTNLVNQTVDVSWTGFRPSSATRLDNSGYALDINTENPVRVYQCRGD